MKIQAVYQAEDQLLKMQKYQKHVCFLPVTWNIRIKVTGCHTEDSQDS